MSTIDSLLKWASEQITDSESAQLDARLLLCHVLECNPAYLLTWPEKAVEQTNVDAFSALVELRKQGHPVAHLLGYRDFWTLRLKVSPDTLIPRPETELLVEKALELPLAENAKVLDLGTGTGAIALALASEKSAWQILGADVVQPAVALAMQNGKLNQIANAQFIQSDWFDDIPPQQFQLIISNPPYVESNSEYLHQGDVRFEPLSALTSGEDGLDDIRRIITHAKSYLSTSGWLMIEHGFEQAQAIQQLMNLTGYCCVSTATDLNGLDRITFGCKSH